MDTMTALFLFALQAPDLAILTPYEGRWQSGERAFQLDLSDDGTSATLRYAAWQDGAWHWDRPWQIETSPHGGWPRGWRPGETRNDPPLLLHDDTDPDIEWHREVGFYDYGDVVAIDIWDTPQGGRFSWERILSRRNGSEHVGEGVWVRVQE